MSTYNVHAGHNSIVPGASSLLDEVTEDRLVKNKVISLLKAAGNTVYDCTDDSGTTQSKNLAAIVAKCNQHSVDLDISIHLNAGGGTGSEVYYYTGNTATQAIAAAISARIADYLGIRDRGAKASSSFYVLKKTASPAVLIECCFVDSETDYNLWSADYCAEAIAEAVIEATSGSNSSDADSSSSTSSSSGSTSSSKITVDGKWGKNTTRLAQTVFGTTVDGIVSHQYATYKSSNPGLLAETFQWETNPSGCSPLIKAIQKKVGATQDGYIGPKTIKAMQTWLGTTVDGYVSATSPMVKAFQTWLNSQI